MAMTGQLISGGTATGGSSGLVILINLWLKAHHYEPLELQEGLAVVAVIAPPIHFLTMVLTGLVSKLLSWLKIPMPGLSEAPAKPVGA